MVRISFIYRKWIAVSLVREVGLATALHALPCSHAPDSCRYTYSSGLLEIYLGEDLVATSNNSVQFDSLPFSWLTVGASASGAGGRHFTGLVHHIAIIPGRASDMHNARSGLPGSRMTEMGMNRF